MGRLGVLIAITVAIGCSSSRAPDAPSDAGSDDAGADSAIHVPPLTGDYSCVGKITYPAPASQSAKVSFVNIDAFSNVPVKSASVKACALGDTTCAEPTVVTTTDEAGIAMLDPLPLGTVGFPGYFEVTLPDEAPNLNFVSPPIIEDRSYQRIYWSKAALTNLAALVGVTWDPTRGHVFIEAHDCTEYPNGINCQGRGDESCKGHGPGGIAFELDVHDPAIVLGYLFPPSVSRTAGGTYEGIGQGGFINVPPGDVTVIGKIAATGQIVSRQKLFVRAGAYSMVVLQPTNETN
jgi:hypothetical protein